MINSVKFRSHTIILGQEFIPYIFFFHKIEEIKEKRNLDLKLTKEKTNIRNKKNYYSKYDISASLNTRSYTVIFRDDNVSHPYD